jgi:tyrosinase
MTYTRKNILHLTSAEEQKLVDGFRGLLDYPFTDFRGFLYWAGYHGFPEQDCEHANAYFLAWHRPYVLALERALQDVLGDDEFGLPYWNWTAEDLDAAAIPEILKQPPLDSVRILWGDSEDRDTHRDSRPTTHPWFSRARGFMRQAFDFDVFENGLSNCFQDACENGHNYLHVWVGGDMADPDWAAFDPIFWFHHCNVDRLWAKWQDEHPNAVIPDSILDRALDPFPLTGGQVMDYRALGYEYSGEVDGSDVAEAIESLQSTTPLHKRFRIPEGGFETARLAMENVQYPEGSLEVRVYLNDKDATALSEVETNPHCAGVRAIFSHAACAGSDPGHCSWRKPRRSNDPRGPHHRTPFDLDFDVTKALRAVSDGRKTVDVSVLLVDVDGEAIPTNRLKFDRLTLRTMD